MPDPWRIFKDDPGRQETLRILWPDLYHCLAELDGGGPARVLRCVLLANHLDDRERPLAVGRINDEFGHPACRDCLGRIHGPGHAGWPLKRERKPRA